MTSTLGKSAKILEKVFLQILRFGNKFEFTLFCLRDFKIIVKALKVAFLMKWNVVTLIFSFVCSIKEYNMYQTKNYNSVIPNLFFFTQGKTLSEKLLHSLDKRAKLDLRSTNLFVYVCVGVA